MLFISADLCTSHMQLLNKSMVSIFYASVFYYSNYIYDATVIYTVNSRK